MKFLKGYKKFLNERVLIKEDVNPSNNEENNIDKVVVFDSGDNFNTKERAIESIKVIQPPKSTLSERGPDLKNEAVMKKGENPDSLNIAIDSERLEYAWRMISKDVEGAIKATKIEKDGKIVATNIKKDAQNNVTFDFTFENKDSTQNTDPSGKTTKNILAGKLISQPIQVEKEKKFQVWVVLNSNKANISLDTVTDKVKFLNMKRQLLEAGYTPIEGTYNFKLQSKGEWVTYGGEKTEKSNQPIIDFFAKNKGSYFDVQDLYTKFGIDPKTKQSTGQPNWSVKVTR